MELDDTDRENDSDGTRHGEKRTVRLLVSSRSAAIGTLAGYVFAGMGFYTNFFKSILQATAFLVDTVAILAVAALYLTGAARDIWRSAGPRRSLTGTAAALLLVAGVNYLGFRPPSVLPAQRGEACTYDVRSQDGVAIPLVQGGSITQKLRPLTGRINSVSVIAGLDGQLTDIGAAHPIKLIVRSEDRAMNETLPRLDIVNNGFSRFEFEKPWKVSPQGILTIEVINDSEKIVSIYVKLPGPNDFGSGAEGSVFIQGHLDNEPGYEKTGYLLSGCVTKPGD